MREILQELNQSVGVRGSSVVTRDGIVVASALTAELDEDAVAAMASTLVLNTISTLERVGFGGFSLFTIQASSGKMVVADAEVAFLVVVTDPGVNLDLTMVDISAASYRLKKRGRLGL
ncbi:MAG: roadblock/LC7 domain-containing protein [Planctomycetes bacterium]|nr:roadblock/LC7 domain-containing protein [Planctomycetota bacterium]